MGKMMSILSRSVQQVRRRSTQYENPLTKIQSLLERVDTTLNASITELFPALAFNNKFRPSSVEDFKKFLYTLNLNAGKSRGSFDRKDAASAKLVIDKLPTLDDRFLKTKMENAIGITNYLYDLDRTKPIKNVIWGYRAKPRGVPNNHAGDIFIEFKNRELIGVSLKAGTEKSKEPLKNTYVGTQYKALGIATKKLESDLWDRVYSKVPGVKDIATKDNFVKNKEVTKAYVDYYVEDEEGANKLYTEMLVVCREHFCDVLNKLSIEDFIDWVQNTFNLQRKEEKVPLIMVKAVGTTASQKTDDIVDMIPMITRHYAFLNRNSVQEYLIDIHSADDKKTLKMTIRSDSGVRPEKGTSGQGRLGQYLQLKMQYSGVQ
tara:strand:- start:695 stop:1819 length:1125 start_codon:yes stop_codon:yes gene_type:complete